MLKHPVQPLDGTHSEQSYLTILDYVPHSVPCVDR